MSAFFNGSNYLALPRNPQKWLVENLIPSAGTFNLYGKSKAGKSYAMLALAEAIGNPLRATWNGFPVLLHGPVLFLQLDTPREEWADRIEKFTSMGFDFTNVHSADINTIPNFPFDILDVLKANAKVLQEAIQEIHPVLVVIDTLRDAHSGDENDSTVMRNVLLQLIKATQPAICGLLSHRKKESQHMKAGGDDIMDDVRGSSAVVGKMDNVIYLTSSTLAWKGRAGSGSVSIKQDEDTGLILLDGSALQEEASIKQIVHEQQRLNPQVTKSDIATEVCKQLKWDKKNKLGQLTKHRTAVRRIEAYF